MYDLVVGQKPKTKHKQQNLKKEHFRHHWIKYKIAKKSKPEFCFLKNINFLVA